MPQDGTYQLVMTHGERRQGRAEQEAAGVVRHPRQHHALTPQSCTLHAAHPACLPACPALPASLLN
jgi:hypothetical protein